MVRPVQLRSLGARGFRLGGPADYPAALAEPGWRETASGPGMKLVPAAALAGMPGPQPAAPQGTNRTITTPEDILYIFGQSDFGFQDGAGDNDSFAGVFISTAPVNGVLAFEGNLIGAGSFITAADINAGKLSYEPNQNGNGSPYASFTFQVIDSAAEMDPSPNMITVNVTAVNDAPIYMNFNSWSAGTFNEGQANPIFIDAQRNGTVSDVDSINVSGGYLRVSITQNGVAAEDRLGIANIGGVTISGTAVGSTVSVNGVVIGTIAAGGTGIGEDLVVSFNAIADLAQAQALIRALTYFNANSEGPSQASRNIAITLNDGDGPQLGTYNVAAHIMGWNDAPTLSSPTQAQVSYQPGNAPAALWAGVTVTDPDNQPNFQMGSFSMYGGGAGARIDLIGTRFVKQEIGGFFTIIDTLTNLQIGQLSLTVGHASVSNLTTAATLSVVNALIQSFGFSTEGANPAIGNFQSSLTFFDGTSGGFGGGLTSNMVGQIISIGSASPVPIIDLNGIGPAVNSTILYVENGTPVGLSQGTGVNGLAVFAANGGNQIDKATVTLGNVQPDDVFTYGALPAGVTASVVTTQFQMTITFTGAATPQAYTALLDSIRFSSTSENPLGSRWVNVTVEAGAIVSATASAQIFIQPVDDPGIAHDDAFVAAATGLLFGNVGFDNGFGADEDPEGSIDVVQVNGSAGNVGSQITLASGAQLLVQASGALTYNANNAFGGAAAVDSFTYMLKGGSIATVTINVLAVPINGTPGDDMLTGTGGADTLNGGAGADTMTGLGGNDTYYVDHSGDLVVEAAGGGVDIVRASTSYALAAGTEVERLEAEDRNGTAPLDLGGNEFGNVILGNAGANALYGHGGDDRISGGGGNDRLIGGGGSDRLEGGAGSDVFAYEAVGDSFLAMRSDGAKFMPDVIMDFTPGQDLIDLSAIDANLATPGNDSFTFIGTNAFSGIAGQLRYESHGNFLILLGDCDGNGGADFRVVVQGAPALETGDFTSKVTDAGNSVANGVAEEPPAGPDVPETAAHCPRQRESSLRREMIRACKIPLFQEHETR